MTYLIQAVEIKPYQEQEILSLMDEATTVATEALCFESGIFSPF